jgi:hypothetical protein
MTRALLISLTTLAALTAPDVQANPVTYHYEASAWQTWMENSGHGFATYAGPQHASVLDFTLAAPLAANLGRGDAPLLITNLLQSWSYDGGQAATRVDSTTASSYFSLYVWTGSAGEILRSNFYINEAPIHVQGLPPGTSGAATLYVDSGYIDSQYGGPGFYLQERVTYANFVRCQGQFCYGGSEGGSTYSGGQWSAAEQPGGAPGGNSVPEPTTLALCLAGLLAAYSPKRLLRPCRGITQS